MQRVHLLRETHATKRILLHFPRANDGLEASGVPLGERVTRAPWQMDRVRLLVQCTPAVWDDHQSQPNAERAG